MLVLSDGKSVHILLLSDGVSFKMSVPSGGKSIGMLVGQSSVMESPLACQFSVMESLLKCQSPVVESILTCQSVDKLINLQNRVRTKVFLQKISKYFRRIFVKIKFFSNENTYPIFFASFQLIVTFGVNLSLIMYLLQVKAEGGRLDRKESYKAQRRNYR